MSLGEPWGGEQGCCSPFRDWSSAIECSEFQIHLVCVLCGLPAPCLSFPIYKADLILLLLRFGGNSGSYIRLHTGRGAHSKHPVNDSDSGSGPLGAPGQELGAGNGVGKIWNPKGNPGAARQPSNSPQPAPARCTLRPRPRPRRPSNSSSGSRRAHGPLEGLRAQSSADPSH